MASPIPTTCDQSSQPQETFASSYDLDNPLRAIYSYSRLIHQHTKSQMETATRTTSSTTSSLSSESSIDGLQH